MMEIIVWFLIILKITQTPPSKTFYLSGKVYMKNQDHLKQWRKIFIFIMSHALNENELSHNM